jgi:hypothetical protein
MGRLYIDFQILTNIIYILFESQALFGKMLSQNMIFLNYILIDQQSFQFSQVFLILRQLNNFILLIIKNIFSMNFQILKKDVLKECIYI